jgi:hypothetical protein
VQAISHKAASWVLGSYEKVLACMMLLLSLLVVQVEAVATC